MPRKKSFFRPWIGKNYGKENNLFGGKRILLLGESHYGCDNPADTENILLKHISREKKLSYFTKLQSILGFSEEHPNDFWDSVVFYNYLQVYLEQHNDYPNKADDEEIFQVSKINFFNILENYKPDLIISVSKRLYYNFLPEEGKWNEELSSKLSRKLKIYRDFWNYKTNGKSIPCTWIHHLSSPFGNKVLSKSESDIKTILNFLFSHTKTENGL